MSYRDMREYLEILEERNLLKRVRKEVDKDWEISAVCRVLFTKIPSDRRPALMFEEVKGFDIPVVVGILGASPGVYATALEISPGKLLSEVAKKWSQAITRPIAAKLVDSGPCKENILRGEEVDLQRFPVPIWTVGEDPGPYLTSPYVVTKDPETGILNVGTYRAQIKGRGRTGIHYGRTRHIARHIMANEEKGRATPVAIVLGTDPTIGLTSVAPVPYGTSELDVAGGLRGEAVEVVKCETVNLEVPATAEIIIEGEFPPHLRETEGPFGEYTGYMGPAGQEPLLKVKCITFRDKPIYQAFLSQMPPSESSLIRSLGRESSIYNHLTKDHRLPVRDVHIKESSGAAAYLAISMNVQYPGQVWETIWAAWTLDPSLGKFTVVVDEDIDVRDPFALEWALSFRVCPHRDIQILKNTAAVHLDPATAPRDVSQEDPARHILSKVAIDATKKHAYPPIALPPSDHLERVKSQWKDYGIE